MPLPDAFFASAAVHDRKVTLADGQQYTVYFKEVTAVEVRSYQIAEQSEDSDEKSRAIARLIAASVCEPDGKRSMTYEQAQALKPKAAIELLRRVLEVNQIGGEAAKKILPSGASDGSGTS